jgi:hypothetical protein
MVIIPTLRMFFKKKFGIQDFHFAQKNLKCSEQHVC